MRADLEGILNALEPVLQMSAGTTLKLIPEIYPANILSTPRGARRQSLRKSLKGILYDLDSTMKSIVQAQGRLDSVRVALFRQFVDCTNALSSIHELPIEVLRLVLVFAVDGDGYECVKTRNSVNLVCQKWRRLALDSPQIWTNIHLSWPPDIALQSELAGAVFKRSRGRQVSVTTTYRSSSKATAIDALHLHTNFHRIKSISILQYPNPLPTSERTIADAVARFFNLSPNQFDPNRITRDHPVTLHSSSRNGSIMTEIYHLVTLRTITLSNVHIIYTMPTDNALKPLPIRPEMACEELILKDMTLESAMNTLGSIPAPHLRTLMLSKIALPNCTDNLENLERVDYNRFFANCNNREVIENVVMPGNLEEFRVDESDRVFELIGMKWKFTNLVRIDVTMGCDWNETSSLKDTIKEIVST